MKYLFSFLFRQHRIKKIICVICLGCLVSLILATMKFNITHNYEGIFLLKVEDRAVLEVNDDLYLGEGQRYIAGIDLEREKDY